MIIELGHFALIIALIGALFQAVTGLWAGHSRDLAKANVTNAMVNIVFVNALLAFFALVYAYVVSDFSVQNVVQNSHTLKPLIYKISGAWGNHEGSMLLWVLVGAGFAFALVHNSKHLSFGMRARALGIQGLIVSAILGYIIFASNPFIRLDNPPIQGNDLNPLLQDPALALHPPLLYLGYVGLSLVYSLAIAGLLEGKTDAAWAKQIRPWVLVSWAALTFGIALGSYWAYYELGWGGWWFWDPVENASFMPWLLATALLHSAIVTEKRGALAAWTVLLAILAFSLSLLGTFLVRSGVLTSVHAFALDPERGVWILLILAVFTGGGLLLFGLRGAQMNSDRGVFKIISRESALVLNNLFLVVACFTILVGTLYPLVGEAIYGRAISVGAPYFNAVFTPIMAIVLSFLPIATMLSWKRANLKSQIKALLLPLLAAILIGIVAAFLAKNKPMAMVGIILAFWLILGAIAELGQKIGFGKIDFSQSLTRLKAQRLHALGMFFAHIGVGVFILGAVIQTNFQTETTKALAQTESVSFSGAKIVLAEMISKEGPNFYSDAAIIELIQGNKKTILAPERRYYPAAKMPTTEVARKSNLFGEIYIALGEPTFVDGAPKWSLRLYYNPFVGYIFFGAFLIGFGGILSLLDRGLRIGAPKASGE